MSKHRSDLWPDCWGRPGRLPDRFTTWVFPGWHKLVIDYAPGEMHGRHRGERR